MPIVTIQLINVKSRALEKVINMKANVVPLSSASKARKDKAYEEAIVWVVAIDKGLDAAEEKSLKAWLDLSDLNREALLNEAKMWDELNVLSSLAALFPFEGLEQQQPKPKYYLAVASVFIVVLVGAIVNMTLNFHTDNTPLLPVIQNSVAYYATPKGETKAIELTDGSLLTLNTDSAVSINFGNKYRNIVLQKGEIHIKVKKDQTRPLNVLAGGALMQAVGTEFSVQYFEQKNIALIVSEGKVMLAQDSILQTSQPAQGQMIKDKQAIFLNAGEKIELRSAMQLATEELSIENISESIAKSLSWMNGYLSFTGETLEDAVQQINRYLVHPIELKGEAVKNIRVIGRFENGKAEQFLLGLEKNFNLHLSQDNDGHLILKSN